MKPPDIDIAINASPSAPRVVEIDAEVIARIIMARTGAQARPAAKAANEIVDYLAHCAQDNRSVQ